VTKNPDPGAVARAAVGGDQVRGEQLTDTATERTGSATTDQLSAVESSESDKYESMRRWLARERGWRVTFLDRLYREARRKAGGSQ
jgi:hypothetical protein